MPSALPRTTLREVGPGLRRPVRAATVLLTAAALLAIAGCARKGDPVPPADALRSEAPTMAAPGEVTDPINGLED